MTNTLHARLIALQENARERQASIEESTAGLVGNLTALVEGKLSEGEKADHAVYALTHLSVQLGNIASALMEQAVASHIMAAYMEEGFRMDMEEMERTKNPKISRDFIGKTKGTS